MQRAGMREWLLRGRNGCVQVLVQCRLGTWPCPCLGVGATADALTLFERLETKLEEHSGQLTRCGCGGTLNGGNRLAGSLCGIGLQFGFNHTVWQELRRAKQDVATRQIPAATRREEDPLAACTATTPTSGKACCALQQLHNTGWGCSSSPCTSFCTARLPKLTFLLLLELQAALVVADHNQSLQITGNGDVLEPHDGIIAIGSGRCAMLAYQACNTLLQMSSGVAGMACAQLTHSWQACSCPWVPCWPARWRRRAVLSGLLTPCGMCLPLRAAAHMR